MNVKSISSIHYLDSRFIILGSPNPTESHQSRHTGSLSSEKMVAIMLTKKMHHTNCPHFSKRKTLKLCDPHMKYYLINVNLEVPYRRLWQALFLSFFQKIPQLCCGATGRPFCIPTE